MRFDGKIALVTGAASGIGAATALEFARRGGGVALADIDTAGLANVAGRIEAAGGRALIVPTDLSDAAQVRDMVDRTISEFGRIDLLHNNGFGLPAKLSARRVATIDELDDDIWLHSLAVGLTAVMLATRQVLPAMKAQGGGAIVNTASVAGLGGDVGNASYTTVKAALINFTRATAVEQGRFGIRANVICPGFIETPMLQRGLEGRSLTSSLTASLPMPRFGLPVEAANVVLFLASDLASYVNGAVLPVDGGLSARVGPVFVLDQRT